MSDRSPTPLTETDAVAHTLLATMPLLIRLMNSVLQSDPQDALSVPQFRALEHIAAGPLTTTELAKRRRVALASMGELVQGLVERGLVERQIDANDRRQQLLHLTEAGRQRHERAFAMLQKQLVAVLSSQLQHEEVVALATALPALQRALHDAQTTGNE